MGKTQPAGHLLMPARIKTEKSIVSLNRLKEAGINSEKMINGF
jgi:hypothetical protein